MSQNPTISPRMDCFRRAAWPGAPRRDWADWRWQMRNRIRDLAGLERRFRLSPEEREAMGRLGGAMPLSITPYYAGLLSPDDPAQPLRRTKIPVAAEFEKRLDERDDPLGEEAHAPVPGLIHTYPDKCLFFVTDLCATYCRYCTRGRLVGRGALAADHARWSRALDYVRATPAIRDVLLTGGDPLILSDDRLEWLLRRLRAIPHVEMIRLGTKVPATLPQRVTPALARMLRRFHPLYASLHFVHPDELTPEAVEACARLADAGIPLGGQMVLLKGVNDDPATLRALVLGLLKLRVKPYYLHQCDAVAGSARFRTTVETGVRLIESLHGWTSGYAVPLYMIDAPGGGGKVPVSPDYVQGRDGDDLLLRNYRGKTYRYRDPV